MFSGNTISGKVFRFIVWVFFLFTFIIGIWCFYIRQAKSEFLSLHFVQCQVGDVHRREIERLIKERVNFLKLISQQNELIRFCGAPRYQYTPRIEEILRTIATLFQNDSMVVQNSSRRMLVSDGRVVTLNRLTDNWYFELMKSRKKAALHFDYGEISPSSFLWVFALVYDTQKELGLMGLGIDFADFEWQPEIEEKSPYQLKDPENVNFYIVDEEGDILYSSNFELERNKKINELFQVKQSMFWRVSSAEIYKCRNINNDKSYLFVSPFESTLLQNEGWRFIMEVDKNNLLQDSNGSLIVLMIVSIFLLVGMMVVTGLVVRRVVKVPLDNLQLVAEKIANNDFDTVLDTKRPDEIGNLSRSLVHLQDNIKGYREHLEELINARTEELQYALSRLEKREELITQEIRFASSIQSGLQPSHFEWNNLRFWPYVRQMEQVGGDLIDILEKKNSICAYVADVSGHGVPASLITMLTKITTLYAVQNYSRIEDIIKEVNDKVNSLISQQSIKYINYFTLFFIMFRNDKSFDYLSAGHVPAVLYRASSQSCHLLSTSSSMIGVFDSNIVKFNSLNEKLRKGDKILIFSDGIINCRNYSGKKYGLSRLLDLVRDKGKIQGKEFQDIILGDLERFSMEAPLDDDLALLIIEYTK